MIEAFTGWLLELVLKVIKSIWDLLTDIAIAVTDLVLSALAAVIRAIPAPEFLTQYGIGNLINQFSSDILFFASAFGLNDCFAVLAAGFGFRMVRKIVTLGQW
ncbi:DUF2523 domain-containing protein [Oxalicibacterium faecigallinarum]|uniref:DUF2523 domain-containing protein n=1 Tax=Oxalicibacterium faecigallinarum TaxID=573741 RepID=A0A8J3F7E2_9BURK|nr:DUF2523 domain-containing protein [Oxalicibacterium faecigallinarum]GGI21067.1 hypothetical protein GCM10008066_27210 [Oxalicibacterium faecigallinarum]